MIRRIITTIMTSLFIAVLAIPAAAQMSDDQILSYAKEALSSGKSTEAIVKELAAKGVTMDQVKRIQSMVNGSTGMSSFSTTLSEVGGQERMR